MIWSLVSGEFKICIAAANKREASMAEIPIDPSAIEIQATITTAFATLEAGKELLELVHQKPNGVLPACAVVMAASALEQGLKTSLHQLAVLDAKENGHTAEDTDAGRLIKSSFRNRMKQLPYILSAGCYELDGKNTTVRILHDLISQRNSFMHIDEESKIFEYPDVKIENGKIKIVCPMPENPWFSFTSKQANDYLNAVEEYHTKIALASDEDRFNTPLVRRRACSES